LKKYYPFLDGFRAFAILAVLIAHVCNFFNTPSMQGPIYRFITYWGPLGHLGVDVFFVISGFLITGVLIRDYGQGIAVGRFYIRRFFKIALYLDARVHLAHMSLKRSCDLIRFAKSQGIKVTAEACPHHFVLTDEACSSFDPSTKVNPPLRSQEDVDAIKAAIADGTIDCIVTDHAPHTKEDKEVGFDGAPFGLIGLETSLALTITELVKPGIIDLCQMVDRMSTAPARIVGLAGKGMIKQGHDADITIIDPDQEWTVTREGFASKSKNSPFIGRKLKGQVEYTICGGKMVYRSEGNG